MSTGLLISLILLLPLLGGLIGGAAKRTSIPSLFMGLTLTCSLILLFTSSEVYLFRWEWLNDVFIGIRLDKAASVLLVLVSFISLLVHLFSLEYMKRDPGTGRYFIWLGFFTFSMLGLVVADHLILFFIFWELVGFASYLLIGFWYERDGVPKSAKTAFMVNRVADVCLLAGILMVNGVFDSLFLSEMKGVWLFVPSMLIAIGAFGKSAQLPFSGWLTKAMAGPTPVSALIHAATMVAAGVYLLYRVSPFLHTEVLTIIVVIGAVTTFYGAVSALTQLDIKKALAYSTISQLGYMVLGIGVGAGEASMFHLWTHAFFKAGLFLGAGSVIHYFHQISSAEGAGVDAQDMRIMGGLRKELPWTFRSFLICALALAGIPFFSGFMSKEGIILASWEWASALGTWAYLITDIALITILLTTFYIGRVFILVFMGESRLTSPSQNNHGESFTMKMPLVLLATGSLWFFYRLNPLAHESWLHDFFGKSGSSNSTLVTAVSIALSVGGLLFAWVLFRRGYDSSKVKANAFPIASSGGKIILNGLYLEQVYHAIGVSVHFVSRKLVWVEKEVIDRTLHFFAIGGVVFAKVLDLVDKLIIDGFVNLSAHVASSFGKRFTGLHSKEAQWQLIWVLLAFVLILTWIIINSL